MTTAIVVSKDRPAQLDLLLRSLATNAPGLTDDVHVIWQIGRNVYEQSYALCANEHPTVAFHRQYRLEMDVLDLIDEGDDEVMFLTDDSVFYRPLPSFDPTIALELHDRLLCFSLRLGRNTSDCYPLRRAQHPPAFTTHSAWLSWHWRKGDADYGYPGSLDGHVFRRVDALWLIDRKPFDWVNPNELEERLNAACRFSPRDLMGSFEQSVLVGIPANKTGVTHLSNRTGETHPRDPLELNARYLAGERLELAAAASWYPTAAHAEFPLEFA